MPIVIPDVCIAKVCDVCRLVGGDSSFKLCGYCHLCDAFICQDCINNWPRRLKAAVLRELEPGYKGIPNYVDLAQQGDLSSQSSSQSVA